MNRPVMTVHDLRNDGETKAHSVFFVVTNGLKISSRNSSGTPGPVSDSATLLLLDLPG